MRAKNSAGKCGVPTTVAAGNRISEHTQVTEVVALVVDKDSVDREFTSYWLLNDYKSRFLKQVFS